MVFDDLADYCVEQNIGRFITKEESLEILGRAAEAGLVHMTQNLVEGTQFICNCDPVCCVVLRSLTKFRNPRVIASSNFLPEYDKEKCTFCEKCISKCPMLAIQHYFGLKADNSNEKIVFNYDACIGCGVCAYNCPNEAISMIKKYEKIPPKTPSDLVNDMAKTRIL